MNIFHAFSIILCVCSLGHSIPLQKLDIVQTLSKSKSPITPQYLRYATSALSQLQKSYNKTSGLWEGTGWWNNANIITLLADYSLVNGQARSSTTPTFQNTLVNAPQNQPQMVKIVSPLTSTNSFLYPDIPGGLTLPDPHLSNGFEDAYYDDEGWWALAWLKVYDTTGDVRYMNQAIGLFDDMTKGYPAKCGGIWWDKNQTANNAIANELFLTVAAQLANRAINRNYYLQWALTQWKWFEGSGLINSQYNINDGIDLGTCQNNNGYVWSHNQGVIIGGLMELYQANANYTYITIAQKIASAAITELSDSKGILHEKCEPNCGSDAPQFKGVLMRNLQYIQQAYPEDSVMDFIENNANSIWSKDRAPSQMLGEVWSGPPGGATPAIHSAATDALVAAMAVV